MDRAIIELDALADADWTGSDDQRRASIDRLAFRLLLPARVVVRRRRLELGGAGVYELVRGRRPLDDLAAQRDNHRVREAGAAKLGHVTVFLEPRYRREPVDEPAVDAAARGEARRGGAVPKRMQQGEEPPVVGLIDKLGSVELGRARRLLLQRAHGLREGALEGPLDRHDL